VNRSIVLNLVRLHQPISRVDLSERTGIFRSSISEIVEELLGDGLLVEERAIPKGRGRVPVHLFLNPNGFGVLGISIRRFHTLIASSGLTGAIESTVSFPTPREPAAFLKELAKTVKRIRDDTGKVFQQVGISVPGLVSADIGEIRMTPSLPRYSGFPIAREIGELVGAPAAAENDCNVGALAELWLNESEIAGVRDFVLVEIGDVGVGAGLILNGELYGGHDRTWVGEFGHMVVDPSGPPCGCGRHGCWELYITDQATWNRFAPDTEFRPARFEGLVELARNGDARAMRALRTTAEYLSLGLSNIVMGLNPERVILSGEITKVWGLVHQTIEGAYGDGGVRMTVHPARFNPDVLGLQGALVLALRKVFAPPKLG
jgi:predicted NBD/HSP70 family sugar kinase/biotin operon repressor